MGFPNLDIGMWEDGEKRSGEFFEAASGRLFSANLKLTIDLTNMHPDLQGIFYQKNIKTM